MNELADSIIMCDECHYKGLLTDGDGNMFITDENQVDQPHTHSENLVYLTKAE